MNIPTRKIGLLSLVCLTALSINACSTFNGANDVEEVEVMNYYDPRYYDSGYDQLATEMSDSQITVYGFGDDVIETPPQRSAMKAPTQNLYAPRGVPASDPNVTVFPFDDEAPYPNTAPVGSSYPQQRMPARTGWSGEPVNAVPMPISVGTNSAPYGQPSLEPVQSNDAMTPNRIYFAHDSKSLNTSGKKIVDHVAQNYRGQNISVEGHASARAEQSTTIERKMTNLKVSMDRALNVSRELMKDGVPAESIETKAYGDTRPPLVGVGMDPESAARRVEIFSR